MFTGLIEEIGEVKFKSQKNNSLILGIKGEKITEDSKVGDSICVDGVCLTISNIKNGVLFFDVMAETLRVSTLNNLRIGNQVNLERALKVDARFGGHFVSGHTDGIGKIIQITSKGNSKEMKIATPAYDLQGQAYYSDSQRLRRIATPSDFTQFIVPKGSIAVDGVSLTVVKVEMDYFTVALIPHTLENSTLGMRRQGDKVNIELDILAKYVAKK